MPWLSASHDSLSPHRPETGHTQPNSLAMRWTEPSAQFGTYNLSPARTIPFHIPKKVPPTSPALWIVHRCIHAGMLRGFLHLLELSPVFVESLLDLRHQQKLARLIGVDRPFELRVSVLGTNRRMDLVDARLQRRHLISLCQNLPLPLVGCPLLGLALVGKMMVVRAILSRFAAGIRARSRQCRTRRRTGIRILGKVLVGDHFRLRGGGLVGGILLLTVLASNVAERLPIGGRAHEQGNRQNLLEHSVHNCLLRAMPN